MSHTKSLAVLAGAALSLGGVSTALADSATPTTTDEIRAIFAEMQADAETRTSMLQGGTSGHDGSFYLASSDGSFDLNIGGQLQFRYIANFRDDDDADDFDPGFQMRRAKIWFYGHIYDNWNYKVQGAFDRDSGDFNLEDAYISTEVADGWDLVFGQFKLPFLREELVSSTRMLAVERSVVNEIFNQDRSQGVELHYQDAESPWTIAVAFSDGFNSDNTDFTSARESDWAITGRFQYKFAGDWSQFKDFTSPAGSEFASMLGVAGHWQEMTTGKGSQTDDPTDVDVELLTYTVDLSLEGDSWNAFAAFVGRHLDAESLAASADVDDFGVVVQGGYRFTENTELFGRWDWIIADDDRDLEEDNFHFLTAGVNHYYHGHAAKATADVIFALNETTDLGSLGASAPVSGFPNTGLGLLGSMEEGEVAVRFQFQLLF